MEIRKVYLILKKELRKYNIPLAEQINIKTKKPFFVLIGTILSARTNDKTTSKACDKLFSKVKDFRDLDKLSIKQIEKLIYPVGFYKNKAKYLKKLPNYIENMYDGKIPQTITELIKLPGVGRKTANLIVSVAFGKEAICVDTHVHKVMNRIGFVKTKTPLETEKELRKKLPKKLWKDTNYLLVMLGQNICLSRNPNCDLCPIKKMCPKIGVK